MVDQKLYDTFAPPERLTLLLQAMARQDDAEVSRLRETCPRATYTQPDAAFDDRVHLAFDILAVTCIDLRAMTTKLFMVEWAKDVLRHLAPAHHITATLGFIDGAQCSQGLAQSLFFAAAEPGDEDLLDNGDDGDDEPELARAGDFGDRMVAVGRRAERATAEVFEVFDAAGRTVAQDLVDLWSAFDRFCRTRIGVDGPAVFQAWQMPLLEDVEAMLKLHRDLKPDPAKVREHQRLLNLNWDRRFGTGGGDGG